MESGQFELVGITQLEAQAIDGRMSDKGPTKRMVRLRLHLTRGGQAGPQPTEWYTVSLRAAAQMQASLATALAVALHPESTGPSATAH